MKKNILLVSVFAVQTSFSQNIFPASANVGIGTTSPNNLLEVSGYHEDSRILLHSHGNGTNTGQADLMLWASEPGVTWTGVGIGNNVQNFKQGVARTSLLNPARGGSYIRLLDCSMSFNVINSGGLDKQAMSINDEGNVGIGTTNPDSKLTVAGNIHAREVKVTINAGVVPDYVFTNDYKLKSLQEVEDYIKQNSHLPEIPSATQMEKNGLMLAEMNLSLLKKMEEMTLYIIEQNKSIENLKKDMQFLKSKL